MSKTKLKVALVGCGGFGQQFARYILEVADLPAISDPDPASLKAFSLALNRSFREYENFADLLASEDIDAIAITSPNFAHKDVAIAAAKSGKHIYCEKPMATSVPECWEMVRAAEQAGVRLMVGHKRRLRPPWSRMIELRENIGSVIAITSCQYYDARPYDLHGWWTRVAQSGGLLDIAEVHILDWMRAMCGDIESVRAISPPQLDSRFDFPDTIHVDLRFKSQATASLNVSMAYPLLKFREAGGPLVVCRNGGIRFVPQLDHVDLYWQHEDDQEMHHERFDDLGFDYAFRKEIRDFVNWVQQGNKPCLTWEEGLRCVEGIEAAHRSAAQNGSIIRLPLYPELEQ
jgi:predicted dehydrogenase